MNPQSSKSPEPKPDPKQETLLKEFRAYLHLVITAHQTGQDKELEAMPGPNLMTYCRALAELPHRTLAWELAVPVAAILRQLSKIAPRCKGTLRRTDEKSAAMHQWVARVLAEIDLAFGFILRNLNHQLRFRGEVTKDSDFLCEALSADTHAGSRVARMIRRYYKLYPDQLPDEEGGFVADFAWDVYQRVAELDELADEFPKQVGWAARQMNAWPMLVHRHTNNRKRFQELAKRLELGADYPLDASEGARFRPDTPMIRYLEPLVCKINCVRSCDRDAKYASAEDETNSLRQWWWDFQDERPGDEVVEALRAVPQLLPLTKATAKQWTEKAVVPLILLTDARDWKNCDEPALQAISRQKGVKSKATFKSRLLAAVSSTLRRLARPA